MPRISKYERTAGNDISYRGPLSYRHLLIIGWICISFKVLDILISAVAADLRKSCGSAGKFCPAAVPDCELCDYSR